MTPLQPQRPRRLRNVPAVPLQLRSNPHPFEVQDPQSQRVLIDLVRTSRIRAMNWPSRTSMRTRRNSPHPMLASKIMPPRPHRLSLAILFVTILAGLAIRFAPLGLPAVIVKYGGSALWAMMIYWVVSTILRTRPLLVVSALAGAVCTAVEVFKLYDAPAFDAFRHTLPGVLLLGRIFSVWDILAYWIAIVVATIADLAVRRALKRAPQSQAKIQSI